MLPIGEPEAAPSETSSADETEAGDPRVGDCWTTEDYNWGIWESWRGDAAVDCDEDHESYTYAVLGDLETFDEIYKSNGFVIDEPAQAADDSCHEALGDFMGAPVDRYSRLVAKYFLPSKIEWKAGARWLRCDVLVYEIGSSVYGQEFAELPEDESELVDSLDDHADYFDLCLDTDDGFNGYGPYFSDSAVYSNCSRDPMWRLDGYDTVPGEYNDPYPGDDVIGQYAIDGCLADMSPQQWGYAHVPDYDSWFMDDRSITCWSYEWDVPDDAVAPI